MTHIVGKFRAWDELIVLNEHTQENLMEGALKELAAHLVEFKDQAEWKTIKDRLFACGLQVNAYTAPEDVYAQLVDLREHQRDIYEYVRSADIEGYPDRAALLNEAKAKVEEELENASLAGPKHPGNEKTIYDHRADEEKIQKNRKKSG